MSFSQGSTIKVLLGKPRIDLPCFEAEVGRQGFHGLLIRNAHLPTVAMLPVHEDHRDPFDRLQVVQSRTEPLLLLTADGKLARYGGTVTRV